MLTKPEVLKIREELATAKNPLFLFDDDPDGLCSFLLLYRMHREGHGTVIKSVPQIDGRWLRKVHEYQPDKVFILDMPIVEQEFIDQAKTPVFWIDHHTPLDLHNVHYFNPRIRDPKAYIPTTRLAYQVSQKDQWIAMVGCLGDYHLPDFSSEFAKDYPDLFKDGVDIDQAIYDQPIGKMVNLLSFLLKGKTLDVNKCIKILTRIESPYELLSQTTAQGKYLYKRFERINKNYQELLSTALKTKAKEGMVVFTYPEHSWSFTSELSNELIRAHPDKIVIVARMRAGEMKCSLRSKNILLSEILEKALIGIEGYGGGHEYACGANIKEQDWERFVENLKKELKQAR